MRARVLCQAERLIVESAIDVVDVARFAESLERTLGRAERLFTAAERSLRPSSQAARFAAKEALAKALGAPAGLLWQDAEVVTDEAGKPFLAIQGTVAARAAALGITRWYLSLSHDAGIASAVVIAEGERA
jgi:holo-[acyl-carrier protein] synthase